MNIPLNSLKLFMTALVLISICCCKHEPPLTALNCPEFSEPETSIGLSEYQHVGPIYNWPCYNPENPNEFVFIKAGDICVYNLESGELRTIFSEPIYTRPDWSATGRIIFTRPDYNIWRINPDGTELENLTIQGWWFGANWNKDGSMFMAGTQNNGQYYSALFSADGHEILGTTTWYGDGCWRHDSLVCGVGNGLWAQSPLSNLSYELSSPNTPGPGGAVWLNQREILWVFEKGVFITDLHSKQTILVKENCQADYYTHPTYHPQSNKVIMRRVYSRQFPDGSIVARNSLVIMNPDGTGEEELDIPY